MRPKPGIEIKTPDQILSMRAAAGRGAHAGRAPGGRHARRQHRRPGRTGRAVEFAQRAPRPPSRATTGTPRRSAPRSTRSSCTASPARTRCWPRGTSSPSTAAPSSTAGPDLAALTVGVGDRPRADPFARGVRDRLVAGPGPGAARPPPHRHLSRRRGVRARRRTGSSRNTSATGSAAPCTWDPARPQLRPGQVRLREGMAVAVEPMIVLGAAETEVLADEWTVVSADGSHAAHYEHTVAITADGPWVLTAEDGGAPVSRRSASRRLPRRHLKRHSQKRGSAARPRAGTARRAPGLPAPGRRAGE